MKLRTDGDGIMKIKVIALIGAVLCALLTPVYAAQLDIQNIRKGVVRVVCKSEDRVSMGTGFVINDSGSIITNHHVIASGGEIRVLTDELAEKLKPEVERRFGDKVKSSGGLVSDDLEIEILFYIFDKLTAAHKIWSEDKRDLAILECSDQALRPLSLTKSNLVHEGESVYALGFPGKGDRVGVTSFLTLKTYNGVVASKEFNSNNGEKVYQTTAPFSEGNSGGPLIDEFGGVIGINSFTVGQRVANVELGEAIRYSIQIDELIKELDNRNIRYTLGSVRSGADWFVRLGIGFAILLGFLAVGIATRRGRRAVRDVFEKSRHLVKPDPAPDPRPEPASQAFIAGLHGEYAGRTVPLDQSAIVFGRDPQQCGLVFPASSQGISKRHCVMRFDFARGKYVLEDLGSANGTFITSAFLGLRDMRLQPGQARELNAGDRFSLGGPDNVFELRSGAHNSYQPLNGGQYSEPAGPSPVLRGIKGEYRGRSVTIGDKALILGRDPASCQVVLSRSSGDVSKRHCALRYDGPSGAFVIEDLSSTNGTFVLAGGMQEQIKPHASRQMKPGDRFFLGDPEVLFEVGLE